MLTAERIDAALASSIGLLHEICEEAELDDRVRQVTANLLRGGPPRSPRARAAARSRGAHADRCRVARVHGARDRSVYARAAKARKVSAPSSRNASRTGCRRKEKNHEPAEQSPPVRGRSARWIAKREGHRAGRGQGRTDRSLDGSRVAGRRGHQLRFAEVDAAARRCRGSPRRNQAQTGRRLSGAGTQSQRARQRDRRRLRGDRHFRRGDRGVLEAQHELHHRRRARAVQRGV